MPSIRDLRNAKRRQSFTGRQAELNTFRQLLLADEPEYAILHIYGVGGVGKSTLLGQFRRIAQEIGYPVGQVDLQVNFGVIEILRTLRVQFEGRYFGAFDKALSTYNQVEGRLQSTAGALSTGVVSGLREGIPFGLGALAVDTVGEERIKNWLYQHLPQGNADLYLHADRVLTARFVEGLNALVEKVGKAVVLFDTYELSSQAQDTWLRDIFLDSDLSSHVMIAVAGRDRLGGLWHEWHSILLSHELSPFSENEAREYLRKRGITSPALVDGLLSLTGRFPWSLALITDTSAAQEMDAGEMEKLVTVQGLSDLLMDRFLSQVTDDDELRELVYLCAVPRNFDFDVIRVLWQRDDVSEPLDRLRRFSFVRVRDDGRWSIHSVVRQAINQRLRTRMPQYWEELNRNGATFYSQRAAGWPLYSDEWRWLTLESLYHQTQVREQDGIRFFTQLFESAKRFSHYDFCSELLSTLAEVQLEEESSLRWIEFYTGRMARLVDNSAWPVAHEVNQRLYNLPDLSPALRARVTNDLGRYHYHIACRYLEAVAALEESLTLRQQEDGDFGEVYVLSHLAPAYAAAGLYDKARQASNRCVQLSQTLQDLYCEGWGHYSLGEVEARAGNWDQALVHLEQASRLFQELDAEFELGVVRRRAGRAQMHLGQWQEALLNYQAHLALMRRYDKYAWALRALVDIAELYLGSEDLVAMRTVCDEANRMLMRHPNLRQEARLRLLEAQAALQQKQGDQAGVLYVNSLLALAQAPGCTEEEVYEELVNQLKSAPVERDPVLAQAVLDRVRSDTQQILQGQLVRFGVLVELDDNTLARMGEYLQALEAIY